MDGIDNSDLLDSLNETIKGLAELAEHYHTIIAASLTNDDPAMVTTLRSSHPQYAEFRKHEELAAQILETIDSDNMLKVKTLRPNARSVKEAKVGLVELGNEAKAIKGLLDALPGDAIPAEDTLLPSVLQADDIKRAISVRPHMEGILVFKGFATDNEMCVKRFMVGFSAREDQPTFNNLAQWIADDGTSVSANVLEAMAQDIYTESKDNDRIEFYYEGYTIVIGLSIRGLAR